MHINQCMSMCGYIKDLSEMEPQCSHLISPSARQYRCTSRNASKLSGFRTRAPSQELFFLALYSGSVRTSHMALLWAATKLSNVLQVIQKRRFLLCDSCQQQHKNTRCSILLTSTAASMTIWSVIISHPEIPPGKHSTSELCTYTKRHWQVPIWLKAQKNNFSVSTSSAALCTRTHSEIFLVRIVTAFLK